MLLIPMRAKWGYRPGAFLHSFIWKRPDIIPLTCAYKCFSGSHSLNMHLQTSKPNESLRLGLSAPLASKRTSTWQDKLVLQISLTVVHKHPRKERECNYHLSEQHRVVSSSFHNCRVQGTMVWWPCNSDSRGLLYMQGKPDMGIVLFSWTKVWQKVFDSFHRCSSTKGNGT